MKADARTSLVSRRWCSTAAVKVVCVLHSAILSVIAAVRRLGLEQTSMHSCLSCAATIYLTLCVTAHAVNLSYFIARPTVGPPSRAPFIGLRPPVPSIARSLRRGAFREIALSLVRPTSASSADLAVRPLPKVPACRLSPVAFLRPSPFAFACDVPAAAAAAAASRSA